MIDQLLRSYATAVVLTAAVAALLHRVEELEDQLKERNDE